MDEYQPDRGLQSADAHGVEDPEALAGLAKGRLRAKISKLKRALSERIRDTNRDNPVERQELDILAERILWEIEAALIPL